MVLLASLACLSSGFFLGRLGDGKVPLVEAEKVVQSERAVGNRVSQEARSGEFGLLERVNAAAEARNREARAQLRAIVEKVEEEAGR